MELLSLDQVEAIAQTYGYWAVFGGIALENTGIPLPGETITLVGGFLAGSRELNYWGVLGSAIAGAILGDNFGYWLGRWGGISLLLRLSQVFRIPESQIMDAREQFRLNAGRAIVLGRFIALLRIFAGPMAGIAGMSYGRFLRCNALGALLWATIMVTLAFFVGHLIPLTQLIHWVAEFGIATLLLVLFSIMLTFWLRSRQSAAIATEEEIGTA